MFEGGLRKDIRERVNMMRLGTMATMYDAAMTMERELASSSLRQSQGSGKRQRGVQYSGQGSLKRHGLGSILGSGSSGGN